MRTPSAFVLGKWLRFSRYELRDRCIVPATGAKARVYDPWKLGERPYQSLARLFAGRDYAEVLTLPADQPKVVEGVLDWCTRHGLLGTMYHRVVSATLWPHWERVEFQDGQVRDVFRPAQETHLFFASGWRTETTVFSTPVMQDASRDGAPLDGGELPAELRKPAALVLEIAGAINQEPLDKTWAGYFPSVAGGERGTYPHPGTAEFWRVYAEPVSEFMMFAWSLVNAIEAITRPAHRDARARGALALGQLGSYGLPYLSPERDGTLRQRWVAGSLLSSLAFMAMEDISRHLLHQCETCHTFFLSDAYQARYCSPRCRHTLQKRRYRQSKLSKQRRSRRAD